MWDWVSYALNQLWVAVVWLRNALGWLGGELLRLAYAVGEVFKVIARSFVWVITHLWRGITALGHLKFSTIWAKLKAGYNRFLQGLDWWRRRVLEPVDRLRRQIWQIYRTFFKPIILFIDSLRVFVRMVAIFDRKLAARLDHYLMSLEGKLLAPITATLRRLNAISSYFTALITTAGGLARPLLLESMRRDALLVWEVLTNPRAMIYSPPPAIQGRGIAGASRDFREYLEHATGPLAMTEAADRAALLAGFEEAQ